jgi:beta-lactamase regulating signal transducer with metallopeptidase domain/thiol-disulfide isomerase/thioredoxin
MNASLHAFIGWLLRSSWQAALLTVLIFVAQFCLGKRLDGRWRHALWFLVLVRLILPWTPPSPASLFNYVRLDSSPAPRTSLAPALPSPTPPAEPTAGATATMHLPAIRAASTPKLAQSAPQPRAAIRDWAVILALVWAAGVAMMGARVVVQNIFFRRRLRLAPSIADRRALDLFAECRSTAGASKPVALVETGMVNSPALYGLFKLRLLLPPGFADRFAPPEMRHIFLHELSHIRRHDLEIQWLMTGLQAAHWFNPVLWLGFRRMAADRELACDELALTIAGEEKGAAYGHTIVKLLECSTAPLPGLVGIMEDKKQIFQRVSMIAAFRRHPRWSATGAATALALALATLTGAQTEKGPTAAAPASPAPSAQSSEIGKKVAEIEASWETPQLMFDGLDTYARQMRELVQIGKPAVPALCAALDRTQLDRPMRLLGFTLRAIGDPAAAPALIRAIPKTLEPPGSDYRMSLPYPDLLAFMTANQLDAGQAGRMNGFGIGRPVREICGALAKITGTHVHEQDIYQLFLDGGEPQRAAERKAFHDVASRWADWWKANHQRFVSDPALADAGLPPLEASEPAAAPSRILTGPNVKTSEGAEDMMLAPFESGSNCCLTFTLNRLQDLPHPRAGASGPKASPEDALARAAAAGADVLGAEYRDPESGKLCCAVKGVGLKAWEIPNDNWSKIEEELQHGQLPPLDTPARDWLMHYDTASARYVPKHKAAFLFIARDGSQGILRVTGQITRLFEQSDFGQPIIEPNENDPNQTLGPGPFLGVKIDYKFIYEETPQLKEEENSRKETAEMVNRTLQQQRIAWLLTAYPRIAGTILGPDGKPAAGVDVFMATNRQAAIIGRKRIETISDAAVIPTGADGSFAAPLIPGARLFVANQEGYGEALLLENQGSLTIQMAPWGRVQGIITLEGKPAPHQKVALRDLPDRPDNLEPGRSLSPGTFMTESDSEGRFVFENVPPGETGLWRMVNHIYCESQPVEVVAGKTAVCRLGFNGRVIKGRLAASNSAQIEDWAASVRLTFSTKETIPDPPKGEDPQSWRAHYWHSAEGRKALRAHIHFGAAVEPGGEFRIEDVPPGTYKLNAELLLRKQPVSQPWIGGEVIGRLRQEVEVPQGGGSPSHEPLDLGTLAVQMKGALHPGDPAPDFIVNSLDDQPVRLSDFRGRYVLVDFWATWCAPCRAETPALKAVYDAFRNNPKFAMIGLTLDNTAAAPKSYCETNGIAWTQGYLGEWSEATLPTRWGVDGIPAIFLVDPAGKIAATELRGDAIKKGVEAALAAH